MNTDYLHSPFDMDDDTDPDDLPEDEESVLDSDSDSTLSPPVPTGYTGFLAPADFGKPVSTEPCPFCVRGVIETAIRLRPCSACDGTGTRGGEGPNRCPIPNSAWVTRQDIFSHIPEVVE